MLKQFPVALKEQVQSLRPILLPPRPQDHVVRAGGSVHTIKLHKPQLPISLARSAPFPAPDGVSVKRCFRRNTRRTVAFKRTGTTSVIPRRQTRLAEEFHQNGRHKSDRQQHIHRCHPTQQPPFHRQEDVAEPQGREGNERQIDRWL